MDKRARVFIYGDVIGVGFRAWAVWNARELGLSGWVRNAADNLVEAVFEGPEEKVKQMVDLCHQGPAAAGVEKVGIKWEEAKGELEGFEVAY